MAIGALLVIIILFVLAYICRPKGEEINIRECIEYTAEGLGFERTKRNYYKLNDEVDVTEDGINA